MARWNSGYRESSWFREELPRLEARGTQLWEQENALRSKYGTHWPPPDLEAFLEDQRAIQSAYETLWDGQFEPWFADDVLNELGKFADLDEPGLAEALWDAVSTLVRVREDEKRGEPRLNDAQRKHLTRLLRLVQETIRACGPDTDATKRLIGNWAEAGLLNGLTLNGVVDVLCVLDSELYLRLSRNSPRKAARPPKLAFRRFCLDVVIALTNAGEEIRVHATSSTVSVLKVLLEAADYPAPQKLHLDVAKAKKARPKFVRERAQRATRRAEMFREPGGAPKTRAR